MSKSLKPFPSPIYNAGDSLEDVLNNLAKTVPNDLRGIEVPNSQKPGYSPIFSDRFGVNGTIETLHPDFGSVYDIYEYLFKSRKNQDYLSTGFNKKTQTYNYLTYDEVSKIKDQIGSGLLHLMGKLDISKTKETVLTYYFPNRYEHVLIQCASYAYSFVNSSIYNTLGIESFEYIFSLTNSPVIFTTKENLKSIFSLKLDCLKIVICLDDLDLIENYELFLNSKQLNYELFDLKTLIKFGFKNLKEHIPPTSEDLGAIVFTSGTTSLPKGCILTHKNYCSLMVIYYSCHAPPRKGNGYYFLPLPHVFGNGMLLLETVAGFKVHFPEFPSNPITYFDDIKRLKPVSFNGVPRLYNRVELLLKSKFYESPYLTKIINSKIQAIKNGNPQPSNFIFDNFIRPKIKKTLGFENLDCLISGSAPLSKESIRFFNAVFNLPVIEGYGLSESSMMVGATGIDPKAMSSIGICGSALQIKLKDVPEMNYNFKENRSGEILLKGSAITKGYYKKDNEFLNSCEDGWFKTGDIGRLDEENRLFIIDRIKNFFKLSQGKFIASEKITGVYLSNCTLIEQIYVHGTSLQSFLVGVIGLNKELIEPFLIKKGIPNDLTKINQSLSWKSILLKEINDNVLGKTNLMSYELLKNAHFAYNPFTVENDILTPTFKLKRPEAKKVYSKQLETLYKEGNLFKMAKL